MSSIKKQQTQPPSPLLNWIHTIAGRKRIRGKIMKLCMETFVYVRREQKETEKEVESGREKRFENGLKQGQRPSFYRFTEVPNTCGITPPKYIVP